MGNRPGGPLQQRELKPGVYTSGKKTCIVRRDAEPKVRIFNRTSDAYVSALIACRQFGLQLNPK